MKFIFLKKTQILLIILLFIILASVVIFVEKLDSPNTTKTELIDENTTLDSKPNTVSTKQNTTIKKEPIIKEKPTNISPFLYTPDAINKSDSFIDPKPRLDIDEIMKQQRKFDTFADEKSHAKKKEGWKVDASIGLEDGAIEELKSDPTLKKEMINGKVEFSTSF